MQKLEVLAALVFSAVISYLLGEIASCAFIFGWLFCISFLIKKDLPSFRKEIDKIKDEITLDIKKCE